MRGLLMDVPTSSVTGPPLSPSKTLCQNTTPFSYIQWLCSFFYFWEEEDLGESPFPPLHCGKVVW